MRFVKPFKGIFSLVTRILDFALDFLFVHLQMLPNQII